MTDATHNWTARREAALDKACADLKRFLAEHPGEDIDVPCDVVDTVIDQIRHAARQAG